ncbi:hypothetical protein SNOG_16437 [Parastagonospora nodorum SN15]|uniref:Uncharacterized protein n=1 Tax=Phaeosphaeria nodorum (strain SN15 / ATCC MYA-4574 / FGSC 10173) TaxID=321614 RepID=Q0TVM7_PHANO|nr:hypothetical protein SNOG_16437 [Parastagonospora nodorum SN15]EAT76135.1 hypothetical protein SNOG_16437 [Parastagonospora nodorum SN15]
MAVAGVEGSNCDSNAKLLQSTDLQAGAETTTLSYRLATTSRSPRYFGTTVAEEASRNNARLR